MWLRKAVGKQRPKDVIDKQFCLSESAWRATALYGLDALCLISYKRVLARAV